MYQKPCVYASVCFINVEYILPGFTKYHLLTLVKCNDDNGELQVFYNIVFAVSRYLFTLNKYVRNKNLPEGCIAEGYIIEETLSFCVMYLADGVDSKRTRIGRNADDPNNVQRLGLQIFAHKGCALDKPHEFKLSDEEWLRAHTHVLINCPDIKPYLL